MSPKTHFLFLTLQAWREGSYYHCVKVGHVIQDHVQLCSYLTLPGSNSQHKTTTLKLLNSKLFLSQQLH